MEKEASHFEGSVKYCVNGVAGLLRDERASARLHLCDFVLTVVAFRHGPINSCVSSLKTEQDKTQKTTVLLGLAAR